MGAGSDCSQEKWDNIAGKTATECHEAVDKLARSCGPGFAEPDQSTRGVIIEKFAETHCLKSIVNGELDKRLLPLKKADPAEFKNEMKLQKAFNLASEKACNTFNSCVGTVNSMTRAECFLTVTRWRLEQVNQVNANNFSLPESKVSSENRVALKAIAELKEFSELVCKMPKNVFQGQYPPHDCVDRVVEGFSSAVGELACDGPSREEEK